LGKPLSIIFQNSFDTGKLPDDWKFANICPIFKKGSKTVAGNYKPVSLTSVPYKMMESIIKSLLLIFAESNKLVNNCQHEFVRGRSFLLTYLTALNSGHAHWMRDTELMLYIWTTEKLLALTTWT